MATARCSRMAVPAGPRLSGPSSQRTWRLSRYSTSPSAATTCTVPSSSGTPNQAISTSASATSRSQVRWTSSVASKCCGTSSRIASASALSTLSRRSSVTLRSLPSRAVARPRRSVTDSTSSKVCTTRPSAVTQRMATPWRVSSVRSSGSRWRSAGWTSQATASARWRRSSGSRPSQSETMSLTYSRCGCGLDRYRKAASPLDSMSRRVRSAAWRARRSWDTSTRKSRHDVAATKPRPLISSKPAASLTCRVIHEEPMIQAVAHAA